MIVVSAKLEIRKHLLKPVICPICGRGRIGYTPDKLDTRQSSLAAVSDKQHTSVLVKCKVCGAPIGLIFEY